MNSFLNEVEAMKGKLCPRRFLVAKEIRSQYPAARSFLAPQPRKDEKGECPRAGA